jgi:hypothetical protein
MNQEIRELLSRRPASSREIQAYTGYSQTAVARKIRDMADSIVKIKQGRSIRYALAVNAFGADDRMPLFMVDPHGNNTVVADIRPLAHGGFFVRPRTGCPELLLGGFRTGVYDNLPYFLDDLRPQGFLGRQIAAELARQSDEFPQDPRDWGIHHVGRYLVSNGDDLPGNFLFGQNAHLRLRQHPFPITSDQYPEAAENVLRGRLPGSSAGGEQPKFTAYSEDIGSHVIVKFSPQGDTEIARRWKDILITEYHATEVLREQGYPAAETRIFEVDNRIFLESTRFDRTGEFGRLSLISLQSVDAEFVGLGSDWPRVLNDLYRQGLFSWQHVFDTEIIWLFGRLINNTDMHLGNLSLAIDGNVFRLRPVYDMCSMGFAPTSGEVKPYEFTPRRIETINLDPEHFDMVSGYARDFWQAVADDSRITDELQDFLSCGNPISRIT